MPNEGKEKFFIFNTATISGKRNNDLLKKSQIFWKMREIFSDLKVPCGRSLSSENSGRLPHYAGVLACMFYPLVGCVQRFQFRNNLDL